MNKSTDINWHKAEDLWRVRRWRKGLIYHLLLEDKEGGICLVPIWRDGSELSLVEWGHEYADEHGRVTELTIRRWAFIRACSMK